MFRKTLIPLALLVALPLRVPAQPDTEAAAAGAETTEVIVVTGRVPGPPLWQVTNGENVLWIFPSFAPVPRRMDWDSTRVERVLADAGVYLTQPDWSAEDALTNHRTSLAVLDISELLKEDGLLSRLAEKGYSVRALD